MKQPLLCLNSGIGPIARSNDTGRWEARLLRTGPYGRLPVDLNEAVEWQRSHAGPNDP
jgi:hypothetical protein